MIHRALGGCAALGVVLWGIGVVQPVWALSDLSDSQMSAVDGEGVAIVLENIRATMAPTSYVEAVGSPDTDPSVIASNGAPLFSGANYQFLGLSVTGTGPGEGFGGSGCNTGGLSGDLACALGTAAISNLAAFDNPLILRVHSYDGYNLSNNYVPNTVVELLGPTNMDPFRLALWTQITQLNNSGGGVASNGLFQGQLIMEGKLASFKYSPLIGGVSANNPMAGFDARLFQVSDSNAGDPNYQALGLNMTSAFSGDMRISVNQTSASPNALNQVPVFDQQEGLFIKNLYVYLPMGGLNYQALVFNTNGTASTSNGNFMIELTAIPAPSGGDCTFGQASACAAAYGLVSGDSSGYGTAFDSRAPMSGSGSGFGNSVSSTTYYQSHGYIDMGLYNPGCTTSTQCGIAPTAGSTSDGIYFATGNNLQNTATAAANTEVGFNSSGSCSDTWCVEHSNYSYTTGGTAPNTQTVYNGTNNNTTTTNPSGSGYNPGIINLGTAHMDGILINHLSLTTLGAGR